MSQKVQTDRQNNSHKTIKKNLVSYTGIGYLWQVIISIVC